MFHSLDTTVFFAVFFSDAGGLSSSTTGTGGGENVPSGRISWIPTGFAFLVEFCAALPWQCTNYAASSNRGNSIFQTKFNLLTMAIGSAKSSDAAVADAISSKVSFCF